MWSESPIRRPYPRVRQAGVAPAVVIPPGSFTSGALEDNWSIYSPGAPIFFSQPYGSKDVVVVAFGNHCTFPAPYTVDMATVPFTSVASGTNGNARWQVWRASNPGTVTGTHTIELDPVEDGSGLSLAVAWSYGWDGGSAVPLNIQADWVTAVSASWPAIPGGDTDGWYSPWQTLACGPATGAGTVWDASFANAGGTLTPNFISAANGAQVDPPPSPTGIAGTASLTLKTGSVSEAHGVAGKWLRLVCGWGST